MGYYKDNKARGGGGRNSRGTTYGVNRDGDRQMHSAVCSKCGTECKVPFRPTGEKPVYCSDCFRQMGGNEAPRGDDRGSRKPRFDRRDSGGRDNRSRRPAASPQLTDEIRALNIKLDTILELLGATKIKKVKEPTETFTPLPIEEIV